MSLFISLRSQCVGGAVRDPCVLRGDGTANPLSLQPVSDDAVGQLVAGQHVLFGIHGFNVRLEHGACSLGQLEPQLGLGSNDVFFGVLWPGDFWLPVVNYPFEGSVAMDCGGRLATYCRTTLAAAQSFSFVTHSLGARVGLECARQLDRKARLVCLTAAAINRDCLWTEYVGATANAVTISLLASHSDWVLRAAFAVGDPISDALYDDHRAFEKALGYDGPPLPAQPPIVSPWQIPDRSDYGHGDYLPPGDRAQDAASVSGSKWAKVATFVSRAFRGDPQAWP
jgi:hypothetical protein